MFIASLSIDFGLLVISFLSLLLWHRFRDGSKLPGLFRTIFLIGFGLLIFSLFKKYGSMPNDMEWAFASANVFLLGLIAILSNFLFKLKIPIGLVAIICLGLLFFGKSKIDSYAFSSFVVEEHSHDWEFLIKTDNNKMPNLALAARHDIQVERAFVTNTSEEHELDNYFAVNIGKRCEPVLRQIKIELDNDPTLRVVEWNEEMKIDPRVSEIFRRNNDIIWANDPNVDNQWHYGMLQVDDLHRYLNFKKIKPKKKAKLFVLDSGVDANHEDIQSNYHSYKKEYDRDPNGHGTHCAGIAAAVSNNNLGIASLSPSSTYLSVTGIKVMSPFGVGTQRSIIKGILEAIEQDADVISLSLGGVSSDRKQKAYKEVFDYAKEKNVVVVVAAGNSNDDASRYTPSNVEGVIAVTAVDQTGHKAPFSNYADHLSMPLAAPGVDIYSTMPDNKYAALSGTSMATPFVSGLVTLMKSLNPSLTTKQIHKLLSEYGKQTEQGQATGKLIQPYEVIKALVDNDLKAN